MSIKTMREEFADTMLEVGTMDENFVVLIGDISYFALQKFAKTFPDRFYNVGICEPTMVNMAAGLAKVGFYPMAHTIAPFLIERSFEQIKLNFGYQRVGVNLVSVGSAFDYSTHGCTHHCHDDIALMKNVDGMQVLFPASCSEFNQLFKQTYKNGLPTYFRMTKNNHNEIFEDKQIKLGKAIKVTDGADLTIVAVGSQLRAAVDAIKPLKNKGISAEIVYIHTIIPFDEEMVRESLKKTKNCLVIEAHSMYGGVLEEVLRSTMNLDGIKYESINLGNKLIHKYGTYQGHCNRLGFSVEGILSKAENLFKGTKSSNEKLKKVSVR